MRGRNHRYPGLMWMLPHARGAGAMARRPARIKHGHRWTPGGRERSSTCKQTCAVVMQNIHGMPVVQLCIACGRNDALGLSYVGRCMTHMAGMTDPQAGGVCATSTSPGRYAVLHASARAA